MPSVLIADDEKLARQTAAILLENSGKFDEVWQAEDGLQALELAQQYQPDVVFLDIEMPRLNGIEVASELPSEIVVVFVTAYDEYAIKAFELSAVDYILKPFDDERFYEAIKRVCRKLEANQGRDYSQIGETIRQMMQGEHHRYRQRLVVRDPGRIRLVDVGDIVYVLGAGNYAEVHLTDGKQILHRETLTTLEQQLDPALFLRIHRSTIVRRSCIVELRPNEKGDYSVILSSGETLTLSRRNKSKLEELIG